MDHSLGVSLRSFTPGESQATDQSPSSTQDSDLACSQLCEIPLSNEKEEIQNRRQERFGMDSTDGIWDRCRRIMGLHRLV
jgi:hypothetical protein